MSSVVGSAPGSSSLKSAAPIAPGTTSGSARSGTRLSSVFGAVSAPLQTAPSAHLDPAKLVPLAEAPTPRLGKTEVTNAGLEVIGHALWSASITDAAVALNQVGLVDDSGLGSLGVSATAYAAVVAAPLALVDSVLTGVALHRAHREYRQARGELPLHRENQKAFQEKLSAFENGQRQLVSLKGEVEQARSRHGDIDGLRAAVDAQVAIWQTRLDELSHQRRVGAQAQGPRSASASPAPRSFEESLNESRQLEKLLAEPERGYLQQVQPSLPAEQSQQLVADLEVLAQQTATESRQNELHNELRALSLDAQQAADAEQAFSDADVGLREALLGATRSGAALTASSMQAWQGGLELAGQVASSGFQTATTVLGFAAGGLAIVAGGAAVGLAAYRYRKVTESADNIRTALAQSESQSNDELIKQVADHAIARHDGARKRAVFDIVKSSFSIVGGSLGLVALVATGVGALVVGAVALGIGLSVAGATVWQIVYNRRAGRLDEALKNQVADDNQRQILLGTVRSAITKALEDDENSGPMSEAEIDEAARRMICARNPYYAVFLIVERLSTENDPQRDQTLEFLRNSGMKADQIQRLEWLLSPGSPDEARQKAREVVASHLLG